MTDNEPTNLLLVVLKQWPFLRVFYISSHCDSFELYHFTVSLKFGTILHDVM